MSFSPPRHSLWLLLLAVVAGAAQAADKKPLAPLSRGQLLEFMADWQGDDGQWTDPMTFARIDPTTLQADQARRHGKSLPAAVSKPVPAAVTTAR